MRQAKKTHCRIDWRLRTLTWLALALGVTGCSHTHSATPHTTPPEDPLHKTPVIQPIPSASSSTWTAPGASNDGWANTGSVPAPTTFTASNPASIAGNTGLPGTQPLSIPNANTNFATNTPSAPIPSYPTNVPTQPGTPQIIRVPNDTIPSPIRTTGLWSTPTATPSSPAFPITQTTTGQSPEQILGSQFAARGYSLQKIQQDALAQGVRLTCLTVQGNNPNPEIFETTAPDYASAVRAILSEADRRSASPR